MIAASPDQKKSFAQMAAAGTSITVSSMPITAPPAEQSKSILDGGNLSISLSDACKISNSGGSSNATASTDGNSTSSSSFDTPSPHANKASRVPASVGKPVAVSTAVPAKNPWKMDLVAKEKSVSSDNSKNLPTPAESKGMKPVVTMVSDTTKIEAGRKEKDIKKKEKPASTDKTNHQAKKPEARSSPQRTPATSPKLSPKSYSKSAADGSQRDRKGDKSTTKQVTSTRPSNPAAGKKHNKVDPTAKPQKTKPQTKKSNQGNSAPSSNGNGINHKASTCKKVNGQNNKNKANKSKKQTKRKNKTQKKNQPNGKGANYIPTAHELAAMKKSAVRQVEYFFSKDELVRNIYLRKQMDVEGYLPAAIVFNFPSVLMYGIPYHELLDALKDSKCIDIDLENDCLRVKGGEEEYKKWLFPNGDGTFGCAKWIKEKAPVDVASETEATVAPDVQRGEEEKKDDEEDQ